MFKLYEQRNICHCRLHTLHIYFNSLVVSNRARVILPRAAFLHSRMRSSPSSYLQPRHTPPSSSSSVFKKTPSSSTAASGSRHRHRQRNSSTFKTSGSLERRIGRSNSGSLERKRGERRRGGNSGSLERERGRSGSHERRLALGVSNSRLRTPSPRGIRAIVEPCLYYST